MLTAIIILDEMHQQAIVDGCDLSGVPWDGEFDPDDPEGAMDAAYERAEREFWATHQVTYDDQDRPYLAVPS